MVMRALKDLFNDGARTRRIIREQRASITMGRSASAIGTNCLVLGGGGREYAIAWRLARSDSVASIDVVPGNPGVALFARVFDFSTKDALRLQQHMAAAYTDLAIVGPDELVAEGIGDVLRRGGVAVVAPSREASKIEWSKTFAKELMRETGVPCARWESFANADAARAALDRWAAPFVVKADGLAAGKGVTICRTADEARTALGSPPANSGVVVFEELLEGDEASLHALVDGETVVALPPARDYKRVGDGDTGPNTGGMGAISPTTVLADDDAQRVANELIAPIAKALVARGTPYRGVIFAGLMRTADGYKVLEYNARFGDPEAQVILPRIGGDFAKLMLALGEGRLADYTREHPVRFSQRAYVDIALCAAGYPGVPKMGERIGGLDRLPENVFAFHGATRSVPDGGVVTAGGRVVHVVANGSKVSEARDLAYAGAERITFEGKFYRSDIARGEVVAAV
ncbi:MAG TPA: phosphoribosylamine--glycine ligase [Candidatus Acidoferrales bacterium]|nr:phosphoribosylamine--glycine ligase [Candidatus Acidoferrales bacterium]